MKKPLKVGFDLDGVLLYNPARIARAPIVALKRLILRNTKTAFHIPKHPIEKRIWHFFHLTSIFIAPGFDDIKKMVKKGQIEAHLITARYSFLENDLKRWLKRMDVDSVFKSVHFNKLDEQPHLYKQRLINKFNLDFFVEDNLDIVKHLEKNTKTRIYWIYNFLDRHIPYTHKFPSLKQVVKHFK